MPYKWPPSVVLDDLAPGRSYSVRILASSEEGTSSPSSYVTVTLPGGHMPGGTMGGVTMAGGAGAAGILWRAPRLLLLIMGVTGSALLALNLAIIVCFVKRRNRENRNRGTSLKLLSIIIASDLTYKLIFKRLINVF